jgi:predicted enzyme related to lactoylglutathione lyase
MASNPARTVPRLFRVILPVTDLDKASEFYAQVLGTLGERVSPGRHYFNCGGTILACLDPRLEGGLAAATPNREPFYFVSADLDAVFYRATRAGCQWIEGIETHHWGERAFFAGDPFGNPICFVDETTVFTASPPS